MPWRVLLFFVLRSEFSISFTPTPYTFLGSTPPSSNLQSVPCTNEEIFISYFIYFFIVFWLKLSCLCLKCSVLIRRVNFYWGDRPRHPFNENICAKNRFHSFEVNCIKGSSRENVECHSCVFWWLCLCTIVLVCVCVGVFFFVCRHFRRYSDSDKNTHCLIWIDTDLDCPNIFPYLDICSFGSVFPWPVAGNERRLFRARGAMGNGRERNLSFCGRNKSRDVALSHVQCKLDTQSGWIMMSTGQVNGIQLDSFRK